MPNRRNGTNFRGLGKVKRQPLNQPQPVVRTCGLFLLQYEV